MNSIRRHVEIQRQNRSNVTRATQLVSGIMLAIATGRWTVDGSCDPEPLTQRIFDDLMAKKFDRIGEYVESLAEGIVVAVRAKDFIPFCPQDFEMVALAEAITEESLERTMSLGDLSI